MAEPLKYLYGPAFFERLCPVLKDHIPGFDDTRFIHRVFDTEWPDLELKQRTRKVTQSLRHFLPDDFIKASSYLVDASRSLKNKNGVEMAYPFIFFPDYVEMYGLDHFDESMKALEEMTQLISAEFAIRPFILKYPDQTMRQMKVWSRHENHHVRRLSSEGCRPRLPWAMGLPCFKENPDAILPILENLKKDKSEYVRRSVANNLNDIAKDHPDVVLTIAKKWQGLSKETDWILKHGSRTLLKQGHTTALNFHGFEPNLKSEVRKLKLSPEKVRIGSAAEFSFDFINREKKPHNYRLEYAITYLTSTGKASRKVFKITEKKLAAGDKINIVRKQRFTDFTTRKHFAGQHKLEIIVNGKMKAQANFQLA